jgi:hypothetical protein
MTLTKKKIVLNYSAIYEVLHSHECGEDEECFCFTTSVGLRHESGHTFTIDHRVWEGLGEPSKVKIEVSAA